MTPDEVKANVARSNKRTALIVAGVAIAGVLFVVLKGAGVLQTAEEKCVERGVEHFKSIGSYPTLTNGREATREAEDRCARTTTAFPER